MQRVYRERVEVGPGRRIEVQLPDDTPEGEAVIEVVLADAPSADAPSRTPPEPAQIQAALDTLQGLLRGTGSVREYFAERSAEETRRERTLGA